MYLSVKSLLDFILALFMTIVLSPVLIIIAIIIKLDSKGPVFFRQKRMGKDNREFEILKFRTMRTDTPKDMPTHLFQNPEAFITKSGRFLRKSSLDELPQLFNILKGEMSFIGPRPALWNQFDLIEARNALGAEKIRPGISGWAQVNGRDELPIPVKAELDGFYAANVSFGLDVKILFMTMKQVLHAEGVIEGAITTRERPEKDEKTNEKSTDHRTK